VSRVVSRRLLVLGARIVAAASAFAVAPALAAVAAAGCSLVSLDELAEGTAGVTSTGTSAPSATSGPGSAAIGSTGSNGTTSGDGGAGAGSASGGGEGGAGVTVGPGGGGGGGGGGLVVGDCQSTPILDRFDRADGPLGDTWIDVEGIVIDDQRAENEAEPTGYKHAEWYQSFGPDQEAHVTLTDIDTSGHEQILLLKIVGESRLAVLYSPTAGEVQIWTCTPSCEEQRSVAYIVNEGSRLSARATRDGLVIACVDGEQVLDADVTDWSGWEGGGSIGIATFHTGSGDPPFAFDDFGGGEVGE
jgi:hypothetical protein